MALKERRTIGAGSSKNGLIDASGLPTCRCEAVVWLTPPGAADREPESGAHPGHIDPGHPGHIPASVTTWPNAAWPDLTGPGISATHIPPLGAASFGRGKVGL